MVVDLHDNYFVISRRYRCRACEEKSHGAKKDAENARKEAIKTGAFVEFEENIKSLVAYIYMNLGGKAVVNSGVTT